MVNKENNTKIRVVFFGSAEFSLPSLICLHDTPFNIVAVVTQPDKPFGRGKIISRNVIGKWANENKISTLQPENLNDTEFFNKLSEIHPDIFIVVAYGKILPKTLLNLPKFGSINVHGSLLPKYRGASPVQVAILSGEIITGVSIMQMDAGMDTGPILSQEEVKIAPSDTAGTLSEKLSNIGGVLLVKTLTRLIVGEIKPVPQPHEGISVCKKLSKNDGQINWSQTAQKIEQQVRAFHPWPTTWTTLKSDHSLLKIHEARLSVADTSERIPGDTFINTTGVLSVCCGENSALDIITVQPQNKNKMSSRDYILGHSEILISGFK